MVLPSTPAAAEEGEDFQARAVREGKAARDLAREALEEFGFTDIEANVSFPVGVEVNFVARDQAGKEWFFDVSGGFTSNRPGLRRTDTLWKALGKAAVLHQAKNTVPLVLLTTDAPAPNSAGAAALAEMNGPKKPIRDVIVLSSSDDLQRLRSYARGQTVRRDNVDVPDESRAGWPGRVAVAIVGSDPAQVFLATDEAVLSRVLALKVVARLDPAHLSAGALQRIREALLDERWADAVGEWIQASGETIDAYPDEDVWSESRLDAEVAALEIRLQRIFDDTK